MLCLVCNLQVDTINNDITLVKESAAVKVELLDHKCEEVVEEVRAIYLVC